MTHEMIRKDAEQLAGQFYEGNRSAKFRQTWPSDKRYVEQNWQHFVQAVRTLYARLLGEPNVKQEDKDLMYAALVVDAPANRSANAETPLQLTPNTEQFAGDKGENKHITETYGSHKAFKERLKNTTVLH